MSESSTPEAVGRLSVLTIQAGILDSIGRQTEGKQGRKIGEEADNTCNF